MNYGNWVVVSEARNIRTDGCGVETVDPQVDKSSRGAHGFKSVEDLAAWKKEEFEWKLSAEKTLGSKWQPSGLNGICNCGVFLGMKIQRCWNRMACGMNNDWYHHHEGFHEISLSGRMTLLESTCAVGFLNSKSWMPSTSTSPGPCRKNWWLAVA